MLAGAITLLAGGSLALADGLADVTGHATVIDADTIEVEGRRIRLHAIDTPERKQLCQRPDGADWRCGAEAAHALAERIEGRTIVCIPRGHDRYRRLVAICSEGPTDLNDWLVLQGWALAFRRYGSDYVPMEVRAAEAGVGIWSGEFEPPSVWRGKSRRNHQ